MHLHSTSTFAGQEMHGEMHCNVKAELCCRKLAGKVFAELPAWGGGCVKRVGTHFGLGAQLWPTPTSGGEGKRHPPTNPYMSMFK